MLNFTSHNNQIIEEVKRLIETKTEGDYWDFKAKSHENNADLLHDVICLANSLHNGNKYLILGVDDEYNVCGINPVGRKSQQNYIDFIRSISFAGEYRPSLRVVSYEDGISLVDIIVIADTKNVPLYIVKEYKHQLSNSKPKTVKPYHIYTRIGDTNTPIVESADLPIIEKLWQKRFGLDVKAHVRSIFFAPIRARIDLIEHCCIKENQDFIFRLSRQHDIMPIDDNFEPTYLPIEDNFKNFEMAFLKECKKIYEAIPLSGNDRQDKKIMFENLCKKALYGYSIFDRYMSESELFKHIKELNHACDVFSIKKDEYMMSGLFTPEEIYAITFLRNRCEYYINLVSEPLSQQEVIVQYPQFFNALVRVKQIFETR